MKRFVPLLLLCTGLRAQDAAPSFPKPSWFTASKIARDPFSPVDCQRLLGKEAPVLEAKSNPGAKDNFAALFDLSAISLSRLSIAIINKRAFAQGEQFQFKHPDGRVLQIKVLSIGDGSVALECEGRSYNLQLGRKDPSPEPPSAPPQ